MAIKVIHAGEMRTVSRASVLVGGTLRLLRSAKVLDGATMRTVANFAPAMSAAITPTSIFGNSSSTSPEVVSSEVATCTPSGGVAPFSYAWSVDGPSVTITTPTNASTRLTATLFDDFRSGIATCVVTDSLGTSATATAEYQIQHNNLS